MKLKRHIGLFGIAAFLFSFTQSNLKVLPIECPSLFENEVPTQHLGYITSYNHIHHQPNWVAYTLTPQKLNGVAERTNKFMPDPLIHPETCNTKDYTKSGFDRGHLAPAADMTWSLDAMKESFYMSNITPQKPQFNRGVWKTLEEQVRNWARNSKSLFIVTGPILKGNLTHKIGKTHLITVPNLFFKAIADTSHSGNGIAFVIQNEGSSLPLSHFVITIDSLEKLTGRNFYQNIPQKKQINIEKKSNLKYWNLDN